VALRFLREGRMQTLLIIVGVAAGVAVIAYISALISGLQGNTLDKTLGAQAHVSCVRWTTWCCRAVPPPGTTALTADPATRPAPALGGQLAALVPLLEAHAGVAAVSPMVAGAGLALRGEATQSIALVGVDLDRYDRIVGLRGKVVAGTRGWGRARPSWAASWRPTWACAWATAVTSSSSGSVSDAVRVTALVDLGVRELNRRTVIVPLRAAQKPAGPARRRHQPRPGADRRVGAQASPPACARWPYKVESWQETNAQLVSALNAQSVSTGLIRAVVLVVVVLGIASVLVVSVVQKRREIGILRAMGATRGQVLRVFLVQGAIVGALGSVLGLLLAVADDLAVHTFVRGSDGLPLFAITLPPLLGAAGGADRHRVRRAGGGCAGAARRRHGPGAGHPDLT
jgi:lipoprotein-releasing system permease protein